MTETEVPAFANPRATADVKAERFKRAVAAGAAPANQGPVTVPGVDRAALLAEAGPETAHRPRFLKATFRVPVGIRWTQYERLRDTSVQKWVNEMTRMGYDLCSWSRISVKPGAYPARDLHSGLPVVGERECNVGAYFVERAPVIERVEVPTSLFEPIVLE